MNLTNDSGELTWGNLVEIFRNYEDMTSLSLPQFVKRTVIDSRTYIERDICENDVLPDLMKTLMNIYTGFILSAFNLNAYVTNTQKVRDLLQVVATESLKEHISFNDALGNMLSIDNTTQDVSRQNKADIVDHTAPNVNLPSGRVIQINFGDPKSNNSGKTANMTINLFLRLSPLIIPTEVAEAFVDTNFSPSFKQRWIQMSTGQISFWKDFIASHDLVKRRTKAMKNDKSGVLRTMLDRQKNNLASAWSKLLFISPERQNIANTILIFDKDSFKRACVRNGMDFNRYDSRQRFFNKTFSMIVCTIDQNYNKITMYFHGLDTIAEYDFKQVKQAGKGDKYDLNDIMKSMSQGMAPRF